jgi:hypothetical protein
MNEGGWISQNHDRFMKQLDDIDRDVDKLSTRTKHLEEQYEVLIKAQSVIARSQVAVQAAVNKTADQVQQILDFLQPSQRPVKMQLQFQGGELNMPGKETDTQTIPCSAMETDAAGQPVSLDPASVTWAIDNAAIASLVQNADGSATFKALSVGTANVTCTDNSVTPPLVGADTLTVTAGVAIALALNFGAPA